MKVIIGCEFSATVRTQFEKLGFEAWSCDLLPSEKPGKHIQDDIRKVLAGEPVNISDPESRARKRTFRPPYFDLMIAHPDCTYLCLSGVRWLYKNGQRWIRNKKGKIIGENKRDPKRWKAMREAAQFFIDLRQSYVKKKLLENPRPHSYAIELIGEPSQYIQPYYFGHKASKETGLWLYDLPDLRGTKLIPPKTEAQRKEYAKCHYASPGPDRWKERSRTHTGIAAAIAKQYGGLLNGQN